MIRLLVCLKIHVASTKDSELDFLLRAYNP